MSLNVTLWSTTALTNGAVAAPDIRWSEGQPPSQVNDSGRAMMAAVARWVADNDGSLTLAGAANVYTLTTNSTYALTKNFVVRFKANVSNTGASTLNVDATGAKNLKQNGATALASGDMVAGKFYTALYNLAADEYWLLGASTSGSVTGAALTKTDDTNVTLTLGGSPTSALVNAASLTLGWAGQLSIGRGGTGATTAGGARTALGSTAIGDALFIAANAAAARSTLGLDTGNSPQFTSIEVGNAADTTLARSAPGDLAVEGNIIYRAGGTDVPVADGGSGRSSATAYALLAGGTIAAGAQQSVGIGASGQVLGQASSSTLPSWGNRGVLIASGSFGSGATLDVTNIPQTYAHLGIYIDGASSDTATREFQIRASNNNGVSFSSVTTDYRGLAWNGSTQGVKARATLMETATATAASVRTGSTVIFGYSTFTYPNFLTFSNDGATYWVNQGQLVLTGLNALRFQWDASGNFDSGTYAIYGF